MSIRSVSAGTSTAYGFSKGSSSCQFHRRSPGRVSAEAGACAAKRNQPASKSRQRTPTTYSFTSGEGWILREAGEEGVFGAGAGDFVADGGFSPEAGDRNERTPIFTLSPNSEEPSTEHGDTYSGKRGRVFAERG